MSEITTTSVELATARKDITVPISIYRPDNAKSDIMVGYFPGLGSRGDTLQRGIRHMGDVYERPVFSYDTQIAAIIDSPFKDAPLLAYETHQAVVSELGLEDQKYYATAQSIGALAAGMVMERQTGQIAKLGLITPAFISSYGLASPEWQEEMSQYDIVDRAKITPEKIPDWRRNTLGMMAGFLMLTLSIEGAKHIRSPKELISVGYDGIRDALPGAYPPSRMLAAFGLVTNLSLLPEFEGAENDGTELEVIFAAHDHTFPYHLNKVAIKALESAGVKVQTIESGPGTGHSNPGLAHGRAQVDKLIDFLAA